MGQGKLNLSIFLQSNAKGQDLVQRLGRQDLQIYYKIQQIVYESPTLGEIQRQVTKELQSGYGREFAKEYLGNPRITHDSEYNLSNLGMQMLTISPGSYEPNPYLKDNNYKKANDFTLDNYKKDKNGRIKTKNGKPLKVNFLRRKANAFANGFFLI